MTLMAGVRQWIQRLRHRGDPASGDRRVLDAERDQTRTDAIVAAGRIRYGGRIGGSSVEDEPGRRRDPRRH
ncbi:MAG: hypothetical protein K5924_05960 [Chloroflexi bacterium]|nr:hypothetical protein [Chloroflexota bacterium]